MPTTPRKAKARTNYIVEVPSWLCPQDEANSHPVCDPNSSSVNTVDPRDMVLTCEQALASAWEAFCDEKQRALSKGVETYRMREPLLWFRSWVSSQGGQTEYDASKGMWTGSEMQFVETPGATNPPNLPRTGRWTVSLRYPRTTAGESGQRRDRDDIGSRDTEEVGVHEEAAPSSECGTMDEEVSHADCRAREAIAVSQPRKLGVIRAEFQGPKSDDDDDDSPPLAVRELLYV